MKPVRRGRANPDLFRERLDAIIDMRHGLVRLAALMPWSAFDASFGKFFKPIGRPAKPTRLMVGLHYLKHVYDLSDEEVVKRWAENPYHQYFAASHSSSTRCRSIRRPRLQADRPKVGLAMPDLRSFAPPDRDIDDPLGQTGWTGRLGGGPEGDGGGCPGDRDGEAKPTDSRLYLKVLLTLVGQAKKAGIKPRQSHTRLAKRAAMKAGARSTGGVTGSMEIR